MIPMRSSLLLTSLCLVMLLASRANLSAASPIIFSFALPTASTTSAGIYDKSGKLIRTLWSYKATSAGQQSATWDGLDDFGAKVPAGDYVYRVGYDQTAYKNVGVIGNSGTPPSASGHTPSASMIDVVVDSSGSVYTANGWDESGADFKKWDASGNSVYDAHYAIRNGKPNGVPYAIAVDDKFIYVAMNGRLKKELTPAQERQLSPEAQAKKAKDAGLNPALIQRFSIADGKPAIFPTDGLPNGHIQVYDRVSSLIPKDASPDDAKLMSQPLRALAVSGDTLLAADVLGNRVLQFDKNTGQPKGQFVVHFPTAMAVGPDGRIWVAHDRRTISVYLPDGAHQADPITDTGDVREIAFGPNKQLYVADQTAGQVKVYDTSGGKANLLRTLGQKAQPGDRAADHFYVLNGVAVDSSGDVFTIQREPISACRLAKFSPSGSLLWEQWGAEFVSEGNYGIAHPDIFLSVSQHRYQLTDRNAGKSVYLGSACTSQDYHTSPHGVPRIVTLGGSDFFIVGCGDGCQAYRVSGSVLRLAALVGGIDPGPEGGKPKQRADRGEWSWHDAAGTGAVEQNDIAWFKKPDPTEPDPAPGAPAAPKKKRPKGEIYATYSLAPDAQGNIFYADRALHSLWELPLGKLDDRGNPTYDWSQKREIAPRDTSPLAFMPIDCQHAADGSIYAIGESSLVAPPAKNPFWMGGQTLVRYDQSGSILWAIALPAVCVGLDTIESGGCLVGTGRKATLYRVLSDGLIVGEMQPGDAMSGVSGWLDSNCSVAANTDPRDGMVDVFAEDDYTDRIGWYRFDPHGFAQSSGPVTVPAAQ